jgi:hypothetical protein
LVKVKHQRTADCAVAGYRIHKDGQGVGSLLLGLFDADGEMHSVGVAASFSAKRRAELLVELEPLTHDALDGHPWRQWAEADGDAAGAATSGGSRWNAGKDLSFVPIRMGLVAEVSFGQLEGRRFRHGVGFVRWRPDRTPESCTFDQLDVAEPVSFATSSGGVDGARSDQGWVIGGIVTVTTGGTVNSATASVPSASRIVKPCGGLVNTPVGVTALTTRVQSPATVRGSPFSPSRSTASPGPVSGIGCVIVPMMSFGGAVKTTSSPTDPRREPRPRPRSREPDGVAGEANGDVEIGLGSVHRQRDRIVDVGVGGDVRRGEREQPGTHRQHDDADAELEPECPSEAVGHRYGHLVGASETLVDELPSGHRDEDHRCD